jgi:hypothetical protein
MFRPGEITSSDFSHLLKHLIETDEAFVPTSERWRMSMIRHGPAEAGFLNFCDTLWTHPLEEA